MKNPRMIKSVHRPYPPFYLSLFSEGYKNKKSFKEFLGFSYSIRHRMDIDGDLYYPEYHIKDFPEKLSSALFSDHSLIKHIKEECLRREKILLESVKGNYSEFVEAYKYYMPALAAFWVCDNQIEKHIRSLLSEKTSNDEAEHLMHFLNIPAEDSFITKESLQLATTKDCEKNAKEFAWLHSRYGNILPYTKEEAESLLKELEQNNFLSQYKKRKEEVKKAVARAKQLVGKENEFAIDVMQFYVYYRTQRTDIMNKAAYYFAPKLKILAESKGLTYDELIYCTNYEITHTLPKKEIITMRRKGFALVATPKGYKLPVGEQLEKLKIRYAEKHDSDELHGKVAFKGHVTGIVKIVKYRQDADKLKEGEILVTPMTKPEMIAAMRRAAAFVTDEGGITSHAAILAREMKKPCVMSTHHATTVLKDGDKVEVDAEKGIIRKI